MHSKGLATGRVLDFSAKEEDIGKLLSVKGIIPTVVQTVLGRAGTSPSLQNSGQEGTVTDLLSDDESGSDRKPTVKFMGPRGSDFIHPICIDVDGDDDQEESVSCPLAHDEPLGDGPLRANADDTQVAANGGARVAVTATNRTMARRILLMFRHPDHCGKCPLHLNCRTDLRNTARTLPLTVGAE